MDTYDEIDAFLCDASHSVLVDVRSPAEFAQGHIPGAVNIALFDNEERAIVGTAYVQQGREKAIDIGVDIAYPKMLSFIEQGRQLAPDRKLLIHCWRGGMRSGAMAGFFEYAGFRVGLLKGGYKAYRQHIHTSFEKTFCVKVIGGLTGSGKTEILQRLHERGEQVLDLEALANHRGSAFGGIGRVQPTTEQFENDIYTHWRTFDAARPVYVEDESLRIGKVVIPEPIYRKMRATHLIELQVPQAERLARVIRDYAGLDRGEFIRACENISKRLGLENLKKVLDLLQADDFEAAAAILLNYYDKTYSFSMDKRGARRIICESAGTATVDELCDRICAIDCEAADAKC